MNIFGKTEKDYKWLSKLRDQGKDVKFNDSVDASDSFGMLQANTESIKAEIEDVLYLNSRLDKIVPINSSITDGADSYSYKVRDTFGKAGFVDSYFTNANTSNVNYRKISTSLYDGGDSFMWSVREVEKAQYAKIPLRNDLIRSSTIACINHLESVAIIGDKERKITGLINSKNIDILDSKETFEASSDLAVTINKYLNDLIEKTSTIFNQRMQSGLTIYLPVKQLNFISTTDHKNKNKTILDYLKFNNAWTQNTGIAIELVQLIELKGAGKSGSDRMVIAFNDIEVMEMANPVSPRILGIKDEVTHYVGYMHYNFSQLNFKHPKACLYVDGI